MRFAKWLFPALALTVGCNGGDGDTAAGGGNPDGGTNLYEDLSDGGKPTPPNGEGSCPTGTCNYQTNDGCDPGYGCLPIDDGTGIAPACNPTSGTKTSGEACADIGECAPGSMCAEGACRKLCCGGDWTGCASADEHCIKHLKYPSGDTSAMLCYPVNGCDALDPHAACTKPGEACLIVDATGATACVPEGTGEDGQPCPCKGGFLCNEETLLCERLCRFDPTSAQAACPSGAACVHANEHPAGVGECN